MFVLPADCEATEAAVSGHGFAGREAHREVLLPRRARRQGTSGLSPPRHTVAWLCPRKGLQKPGFSAARFTTFSCDVAFIPVSGWRVRVVKSAGRPRVQRFCATSPGAHAEGVPGAPRTSAPCLRQEKPGKSRQLFFLCSHEIHSYAINYDHRRLPSFFT